MSDRKRVLTGPRGVKIVLDKDDVFPDDPGNGTPVIVKYKGGIATHGCAVGEGCVMKPNGWGIMLPDDVLDWLSSDEVADFIDWVYG